MSSKMYVDVAGAFEWRVFRDGRIKVRRCGERLWGPSGLPPEQIKKFITDGRIIQQAYAAHKAKRRGWIRASVGEK